MNKTLLSVFAFTVTLLITSCSGTKLIIRNDEGKFKIKEQMTVAVTTKDQTVYPFSENCKSTCKDCDPLFQSSRMIVDTIRQDYFVLKRNLSFRYDTIPNREFKSRTKHDKKTNLHVVLSIGKQPWYVYKIPTEIETEKHSYKELGTITYSYKPECYHGGPFKKMFADPNKIRRVKMENFTTQIKVH